MKVSNLAELRVLVDRNGMTIDEEGAVASKPAPAIEKDDTELLNAVRELTAATRAGLESTVGAMIELAHRPDPEVVKSTPVRKWIFTVEREYGEMSRIIAEAVK